MMSVTPNALMIAATACAAALGAWVLRTTHKDKGPSKIAGAFVGWTLSIVGLIGFVAASAPQIRRAGGPGGGCPYVNKGSGPRTASMLPFAHPARPSKKINKY